MASQKERSLPPLELVRSLGLSSSPSRVLSSRAPPACDRVFRGGLSACRWCRDTPDSSDQLRNQDSRTLS